MPGPTWEVPTGSAQRRALDHVARLAIDGPALNAGPNAGLPVTLHFHPDRLYRGIPLLQALAADGLYRSQFETGTSNGGLTAHPGGERWRWESRIFGGAYDASAPDERPKYGALNLRRRGHGAAPRFGSAYLRLRPEVLARCTFCYPDSVFEPAHFGTFHRMGLVALAMSDDRDLLDDYIEAHVHGPLHLERDVEALVLDPCYRASPVELLARRLPCALEWHGGFRLHVDALRSHPEYRGQAYVDLGAAIAHDGWLDARVIGLAAREARHDPQDLKKVWHYVARFGAEGGGMHIH